MLIEQQNEINVNTKFLNPADKFFNIVRIMMAGYDGEKKRTTKEQKSLDKAREELEAIGFTVAEFPPWFPIDLYASRGATDWLLVEVKESIEWTLDQCAGHPCNGAFIPLHKTDFLGTGRQCGFDYSSLAYLFKDSKNVYFIPHEELHQCRKRLHPLFSEIVKGNVDKYKIQREGELSLRVSKVSRWEGAGALDNYIASMRVKGRY